MKYVKVIDKTSLRNGGVYQVLEELENGYFIAVDGKFGTSREFVLKYHTKTVKIFKHAGRKSKLERR